MLPDLSTIAAHGSTIQPISPNQPTACGFGGGGDHGLAIHITVVTAISDQKPIRALNLTGGLVRK
jgi:hypothetical protein